MRALILFFALLFASPVLAQGVQCRTAPPGTSTPNCASEAFVTDSIAAIPPAADAITPDTTTVPGGTNGNLLGVTTSGCSAGSPCLGEIAVGGSLTENGSTLNVASHILLNTLTASNSATLSDITSLTSSYSIYEIEFENLLPATNNVTLEFQVHSGGGFLATGYLGSNTITGATSAITNATTFVQLSGTSSVQNTGAGYNGFLRIYNPANTSAPKPTHGIGTHINATPFFVSVIFSGGWNGGNGAVDGFQVKFSSGNITSGTIKIYGIL